MTNNTSKTGTSTKQPRDILFYGHIRPQNQSLNTPALNKPALPRPSLILLLSAARILSSHLSSSRFSSSCFPSFIRSGSATEKYFFLDIFMCFVSILFTF